MNATRAELKSIARRMLATGSFYGVSLVEDMHEPGSLWLTAYNACGQERTVRTIGDWLRLAEQERIPTRNGRIR